MDGSAGSLPSPVTASDSHLSVPADVETRPRAFNGFFLASRHGRPHPARKQIAPGDDEHPGHHLLWCIRTSVAGTHLPSPGTRNNRRRGRWGNWHGRGLRHGFSRLCLPRTRQRAEILGRLRPIGREVHGCGVMLSRTGAIAAKDDVMFRAPRAYPHNSCKQRCYHSVAAPQNPILAWVASALLRGPEVYLHRLKGQSVALRIAIAEFGCCRREDKLLAAVLLKEFAAGQGLTVNEALCLMPRAAETAEEAVHQLRIWISAIPAR